MLHEFAFAHPTAELQNCGHNIVSRLPGDPWICVDALAVVTVADNASQNVTLLRPVLVEQPASVRPARDCSIPCLSPAAGSELPRDAFDLLIGKTLSHPPHKRSRAGIATAMLLKQLQFGLDVDGRCPARFGKSRQMLTPVAP